MVTGLIVQPSSPIGRPLVSPHRIAMPRVRPARRQANPTRFLSHGAAFPSQWTGSLIACELDVSHWAADRDFRHLLFRARSRAKMTGLDRRKSGVAFPRQWTTAHRRATMAG